MSTQEAEHTLAQMKARVTELLRQINTLEMDAGEHRLVADALLPLDDNRKCFRMVGSVIVERTVAEVLPAVQKNMEQVRCNHEISTGPFDASSPQPVACPRRRKSDDSRAGPSSSPFVRR